MLLLQNVYTDSDLTDPCVCKRLMQDIARLEKFVLTLDKCLPEGAILIIGVFYKEPGDQDTLQTEYYYADRCARTIFFLETYDACDMQCTWELNGAKSYQHLGTCYDPL